MAHGSRRDDGAAQRIVIPPQWRVQNLFLTSLLRLPYSPPVRRFYPALAAIFWFLAASQSDARVFDTVVLDAGHGGWDKGGLRNVKVQEKRMTLLTAQTVR